MGEKRRIIPNEGSGFFQNIATHLKLVWRLMSDERVNPLLKLIPFGTLIYLVLPFDIPTPIDDAAVIWMGTHMFIELCPPEVVEEHRAELLNTVPGSWRDVEVPLPDEEDILDADFQEKPSSENPESA